MGEPYISLDGTVYTDERILHPHAEECTHRAANRCVHCVSDADACDASSFPWVDRQVA